MTSGFEPLCALETLKLRSQLQHLIRQWFVNRQYWEVDTPLLSQESVIDAHLEPMTVCKGSTQRYLQTSPEFAMKRLLASGADRIFQLGKAFRDDELGQWHNPEFTMLEWYAAQSSHDDQMDLTVELVREVDQFVSTQLCRPARLGTRSILRIRYDDAFQQVLGQSVLEASNQELMDLGNASGHPVPESIISSGRDAILNCLLADAIDPWLKTFPAIFVTHYPLSQAALARRSTDDPRTADRFELYLDGLEIANGYNELLDPEVLKQRNRQQNVLRVQEGLQPLPEESRLLLAMEAGLPECAGVAVGFDRLFAWAIGATSLNEVLAFPWPIA